MLIAPPFPPRGGGKEHYIFLIALGKWGGIMLCADTDDIV